MGHGQKIECLVTADCAVPKVEFGHKSIESERAVFVNGDAADICAGATALPAGIDLFFLWF